MHLIRIISTPARRMAKPSRRQHTQRAIQSGSTLPLFRRPGILATHLKTIHRMAFATLALIAGLMLPQAGASAADTAQGAKPVQIVAFGDSLSAGYQLPANDAFPAQLQAALKAKGHNVSVLNAGVSGDTSTGGLARLDWTLPQNTDLVILELGANDALRGIAPTVTRTSLDTIITKLKDRKIKVLLAGMLAPPNMGPDYAKAFNPIYQSLATKHGIALYPFFLEGIAANPALNLGDGMHPNREGVATIVRNILPHVEALLSTSAKTR